MNDDVDRVIRSIDEHMKAAARALLVIEKQRQVVEEAIKNKATREFLLNILEAGEVACRGSIGMGEIAKGCLTTAGLDLAEARAVVARGLKLLEERPTR